MRGGQQIEHRPLSDEELAAKERRRRDEAIAAFNAGTERSRKKAEMEAGIADIGMTIRRFMPEFDAGSLTRENFCTKVTKEFDRLLLERELASGAKGE